MVEMVEMEVVRSAALSQVKADGTHRITPACLRWEGAQRQYCYE